MRALVAVLTVTAYPLAYLAAFPLSGAGATLLVVVPIGVVAFLHGLRWALIGGLVTQAMTIALWQASGVTTGDP